MSAFVLPDGLPCELRGAFELTFLDAVFLVGALLVSVRVVLVRGDALDALVVVVLVASALRGFGAF
jgi:hypothetical protein